MKSKRSRLTRDRREDLIRLAEMGMSRDVLAAFLGVSRSTLGRWEEKDERLRADLARATAEAERSVAVVVKRVAENGNIDAAKFYLARRFPESWGRQREEREVHRVDVTTQGGALVVPGVMDEKAWKRIYGRGPDSTREQPPDEGADDGGPADN